MDNLDLISDNELRLRLMQYGFPKMPVTSTSRNVLIKKLRNYMNNEKLKLRRETTNAVRYSSDEEASDRESKKRHHRATVVGAGGGHLQQTNNHHNSMPPPIMTTKRTSVLGRSAIVSTSNKTKLPFQSQKATTSSVYVSPINQGTSDTEEESDFTVNPEANSTFSSGNYRLRRDRESISISSRSPLSPLRPSTQGGYTSENSFIGGNSFVGASGSELNYRRSYNGSPGGGTPSSLNGQHSPEAPFVSDFTKRLLNLRGTTLSEPNTKISDSLRYSNRPKPAYYKDLYHGDGSIVHQADLTVDRSTNHASQFRRGSNSVTRFLKKCNEQYNVKQTFVPCVLLSGLIVFFAAVAFMYMTISPDLANMITTNDASYNVCQPGAIGFGCLDKSHLDSALDLVKRTAVELQRRAEIHKCVDATQPYTMSAKDVINMALAADAQIHVLTVMKDLHSMEYLIHMNPQWRLRHCDANGNPLSLNDVIELRKSQDNHFAIQNPRLPLLCSIYNKLQTFFIVIGCLGLASLSIYLGYFLYKYIVGLHQSRKERVNILITDIINALMDKSASDPGNPASNLVVINHLRDKLIPPAERNKLDWAWQQAIDFLEKNESRIQFEIGTRNGEDCKMMRWIDTVSPHLSNQSSSSSSAIKRWQSPAFDKTNKVKDPPTSCLKIRQMFDSYEANNPNLKQIIQDAILEKAGVDCKIFDIELDKASCCVYVRCATPADAGLVHDRINGWWFDSSLVSIKFLRLDRYLSRFPKSQAGPTCLRPSNSKNLSMTDCHRTNTKNADNDQNNINFNDDDDDDD